MPLDPVGAEATRPLQGPLMSPLVWLGLAWTGGTAAGLVSGVLWLAMASAVALLAAAVLAHHQARRRLAWRMTLVAAACAACAWAAVRQGRVPSDHISRYLTPEPQLAHVAGVIVDEIYVGRPQGGAFADFAHELPMTLFVLDLQHIEIAGVWQTASGRLLAKVPEVDDRLATGQQVQVMGWLAPIMGPANPGERDYQRIMADRGVMGRLSMASRGNCRIITQPVTTFGLTALRETLAQRARQALQLGLSGDAQQLALLQLILLGRHASDAETLHTSFRQVGLSHLLSISGAHLAILLGLVTAAARLFIHRPPRVAALVLVVLLLYLLMVPLRVPIVRAAMMAGVFCAGFISGRRWRGLDLLALAAICVLVWRPADLFAAGFQLSFGVVAGLLLFTRPVARLLGPRQLDRMVDESAATVAWRWGANYAAVNVVAFAVALPMVAYHFQLVTPLTIVLSLLALPVVTVVLGLGYLKIALGLVVPSAGIVLAGPLAWLADAMIGLVEHAGGWPAATVMLRHEPTGAWTVAALAVTVALFAGLFERRRLALAGAVTTCTLWLLVADQRLPMPGLHMREAERPAAMVNMFAVGDGSCYLLRLPDAERRTWRTFMFDCGSQEYLDVGERSIAPALRRLDVHRIDTLVLSHPDIDHFGGALDLADAMPIGRVLVSPQMVQEARERPGEPTDFLLQGLAQRGLAVELISRGWSETWADATLEVLWPTASWQSKRANDGSIVLAVTLPAGRIMLNGDVQQEAIGQLLELNRNSGGALLRADVTDLPHHGSYVDDSPLWLAAVQPRLVLQSSGPRRLLYDRWLTLLTERDIPRLVTADAGMAQVIINRDGAIAWETFRDPGLSGMPDGK